MTNRVVGAKKRGRDSGRDRCLCGHPRHACPSSEFPLGRAEATTEPEFKARGIVLALLVQTSPLRALGREFQLSCCWAGGRLSPGQPDSCSLVLRGLGRPEPQLRGWAPDCRVFPGPTLLGAKVRGVIRHSLRFDLGDQADCASFPQPHFSLPSVSRSPSSSCCRV